MKPLPFICAATFSMIISPALIAQTATFKFAPPLDKVRIETETRNITTEYPGSKKSPELDQESSVTEVRVFKQGDEFLWVALPKMISRVIDGKPFDNPMNKVLLTVVSTNVISSDGRMLRSMGNERIALEAKKVFSPEAYPDIEAKLNVKLLDEMAKTRWNDTIGSINGRTVKQGDVWKHDAGGDGAADSSKVHFRTAFPSVVNTPSNTVVTVVMFGCNDPKALEQQRLGEAKDLDSEAVKSFFSKKSAEPPGMKICLKRVLDANTMAMISEEEIQREVTETPRGNQIVTERTQRNYSYAKASGLITKPDPTFNPKKTLKTLL